MVSTAFKNLSSGHEKETASPVFAHNVRKKGDKSWKDVTHDAYSEEERPLHLSEFSVKI